MRKASIASRLPAASIVSAGLVLAGIRADENAASPSRMKKHMQWLNRAVRTITGQRAEAGFAARA
jgi:hypothetical protein